MKRRDALKTLSKSALLMAGALEFGVSISKLALAKQQRSVLILYSSKYGATKDTAQWISQAIKLPVSVSNIEDTKHLSDTLQQHGAVVVGSAIFREQPMMSMQEFLGLHTNVIEQKLIASFLVCGTPGNNEKEMQRIQNYFSVLHKPFTNPPLLSQHFGGRLRVDKLSDEDRLMLMRFYEKVLHKPLQDWDRTSPDKAKMFGKILQTKMLKT